MKLKDKIAVVTGGGSGIGAAVALLLAQEGCAVVIAGRRDGMLSETAARFNGIPPIRTHQTDVTDQASVQQLFAWVGDHLGPVDLLVHCAGINLKHRRISETTSEEWGRLMSINATGAFHCMQAVLPQMRQRGDGLVVLISSISGKRAWNVGGVGYCASKFALGALGTAVANEVGPDGVRVSTICPGEVDTPLLDQRPSTVSPEHRARLLQPQDVAEVVRMLACLPPHIHISELVVKAAWQEFV